MHPSKISWASANCQPRCQWSVNQVLIEGNDPKFWSILNCKNFSTYDPPIILYLLSPLQWHICMFGWAMVCYNHSDQSTSYIQLVRTIPLYINTPYMKAYTLQFYKTRISNKGYRGDFWGAYYVCIFWSYEFWVLTAPLGFYVSYLTSAEGVGY